MREWAKGVVKKVTLELIYEVVDERSRDIYEKLEKIEGKIERLDVQRQEDFRYLNQKIDTQIGQLRQEVKEEVGQLRQEIDRINQRLDAIMQEMRAQRKDTDEKIDKIMREMSTQKRDADERMDRINQRLDTIMQVLMDIARK